MVVGDRYLEHANRDLEQVDARIPGQMGQMGQSQWISTPISVLSDQGCPNQIGHRVQVTNSALSSSRRLGQRRCVKRTRVLWSAVRVTNAALPMSTTFARSWPPRCRAERSRPDVNSNRAARLVARGPCLGSFPTEIDPMTRDTTHKAIEFNKLDVAIGVSVHGYQLTIRDVQIALFAQGDDCVDAYLSGRMPQAEAYAIARHMVKQLLERGARRIGGHWLLRAGR